MENVDTGIIWLKSKFGIKEAHSCGTGSDSFSRYLRLVVFW